MNTNVKEYRRFSKNNDEIPIFAKGWWLDAVATDSWNVILLKKNNEIVAAMPYYFVRRKIFRLILQPYLTPFTFIWQKDSKNKDQIIKIINQLPKTDLCDLNFPYFSKNLNCLKLKKKQTFVIDDLTDLDKVFNNFSKNVKRNIKKSQKKLTIHYEDNIDNLYQMSKKTFDKQNLKVQYSYELLKKLDAVCKEKQCRTIITTKDSNNTVTASLYLIWDNNSAYYLIGGSDPSYRNLGGFTLLIWEAIKQSAKVSQKFDFEGSMIESIANYFITFGPEKKTYYNMSYTNSILLRLYKLCNKK